MLAAAQVRAEVSQRLSAAVLTAGRVFAGRHYPAVEAELPCWFVALDGEALEPRAINWPGLNEHRVTVRVDGYASATEALEAQLDTLQQQGLASLFASQPPWPLRCVAVDRAVSDSEGVDGRTGRVTLLLEASFLTQENDPETLIV